MAAVVVLVLVVVVIVGGVVVIAVAVVFAAFVDTGVALIFIAVAVDVAAAVAAGFDMYPAGSIGSYRKMFIARVLGADVCPYVSFAVSVDVTTISRITTHGLFHGE